MNFQSVGDIANNLELNADGIWSTNSVSRVSYPESGNTWSLDLEENSFWFSHRNRCLMAAINRIPTKNFFLDVGGGNGLVSLELSRYGWPVGLLEPGRAGAFNAKKRGVPLVIHSTFEEAGFIEHSLPFVGLFDVIEHIEDDRGFLRNIKNALTSHGRLVITVPAYVSLWSSEDEYAGHFRRYNQRSLSLCLSQSGFDVEYCTYFFSVLPLPIYFCRVIPSLFGIQKPITLEAEKKKHTAPTGTLGSLLQRIWDWEVSYLA